MNISNIRNALNAAKQTSLLDALFNRLSFFKTYCNELMSSCSPSGEALFEQLQHLLDSDPLIREIGLIVSAEEILKSLGKTDAGNNQPFVLIEHNLGISFWCISRLAKHAWKELNCILSIPRELLFANNALIVQAVQVSRTILMINADHYTSWNLRKVLLEKDALTFEDDIRLVNLIFSKHPKSGETWAHRRWVLERMKNFSIESEITVCEKTAELYPKNYYAWSHRRWVMERMTLQQKKLEVEKIRSWVRCHISQNCAFRYLGMLLERVWKEETICTTGDSCEKPKEIAEEFDFLENLIDLYPGHEALWMHRRFLWKLWFSEFLKPKASLKKLVELCERECQSCEKFIEDSEVENFVQQRQWALSYKLWVWLVFKTNFSQFDCSFIIENILKQLNQWSQTKTQVYRDFLTELKS